MRAETSIKILYILPAFLFLALTLYLSRILLLPPPVEFIDRPVPDITYEPLFEGDPGLQTTDFGSDKVVIVNFFASWCIPCEMEHEVIKKLAEMKIAPVYGVAYRDKPKYALQWLEDLGNPYARVSIDVKGLSGRLWKFLGIPSTYIIGAGGRIRYQHIGLMTEEVLENQILPALKLILVEKRTL